MTDKAMWCWRVLARALCFLVFGIGGLLIPLLIVPVLYLLPGDQFDRQRRGKLVIHHVLRVYIGLMRWLGVLSYEIHGQADLKNAQLVLANHPTLIDVVFLLAIIPNANCVVKSGLLKNPFTRGPIKAAGYIINDDKADDVIEAAEHVFKQGNALIVFPEGTRTVPGQPLKLKRGAANIAIRTAADITPVIIRCHPVTLTKGEPWYRVPKHKPHFSIEVKPVIAIRPYIDQHKPALAARDLTRDLNAFFTKEIGPDERSAS